MLRSDDRPQMFALGRNNPQTARPGDVQVAFLSTFIPSSASSPGAEVISKKTTPFETVPSACDSYRMITFFFSSQLVTYKYFSSDEKAIPFGPVRSVVTSRRCPFCSEKTPLDGSSFRGSSKNFGSPNGGSVKYRVPSDRYTRSLGL